MNACPPDPDRRFGGIRRLYGDAALARFGRAHVCVIGVGGVGSWAVEALARSGIGRLTLIDLDNVAESNVNRQIHALDGAFGQPKVEALAARIAAINPACTVDAIDDFLDTDNLAGYLDRGYDHVIDAIDQVRVKIALIAHCRRVRLPLVTVGSAGGQVDPTRVHVADLARSEQDPLLAKVRHSLRRHHGFPRDPKKTFGIRCVYSDEPLRRPTAARDGDRLAGLNCAGFGSTMVVTATFGLFAAAQALNALAATAQPD